MEWLDITEKNDFSYKSGCFKMYPIFVVNHNVLVSLSALNL